LQCMRGNLAAFAAVVALSFVAARDVNSKVALNSLPVSQAQLVELERIKRNKRDESELDRVARERAFAIRER